jgi:hypothetical protein
MYDQYSQKPKLPTKLVKERQKQAATIACLHTFKISFETFQRWLSASF